MKKPILLFAICTCLISKHLVKAQQAVYTKTIANYNSDFLLPVSDNGVYIFGDSTFLSKLNANGTVQWTKSYYFAGTSYSTMPRFYESIYDLDSNIVVTGQTARTPYNGNAFILKLKQNGDTLWCRKLIDTNFISFVPFDVCIAKDSSYIITGSALSNNTPSQRLFIAKISKRGNLNWLNTYTSSFFQSYGNAIQQSPDSGFVVAGARPFAASSNILIAKFNKNGIHQWSKEFAYPNNQVNSGFDVCADKYHFTVLAYNGKAGLMNFDYNGNLNWSLFYNDYPGVGNGFDSDLRLRRTYNKGFLVINKSIDYPDSWILNTDSIGKLNWETKLFTLSKIDAVQNKNKSFSIIGNRGMIIVSAASKAQNFLQSDIQIYKADSLGINTSTCYLSTSTTTSNLSMSVNPLTFTANNSGSLSSIKPKIYNIFLYPSDGCLYFSGGIDRNNLSTIYLAPNPANEKITFESENFANKKINIQLIDLTGKIILNQNLLIEKERTEIDCGNIENGIYVFKVFESGMMTRTSKIVIQH